MIQNLDIDNFLSEYWQKKPLLIRNAFPGYQSPISAEELAGLACEDSIESRVISEHKTTPQWQLENGPFTESYFTTLPENNWTLLIQGLNKFIPELDDLLHQFNFIPSWRVDDLMASYAAPGGSVGPHIDQYDVFLLQASGRRKWMINELPVSADNFEQDIPLNIIKEFKAVSEWVLEAGDMLYLPPNVSHYGIGMNDCITFSIGFRAPSHSELLSGYIDQHLSSVSDDLRYQDPVLTSNQNNGEITAEAINNIQNILLSHVTDKSKIEDWFAQFITEYHNDIEFLEEKNLTTEEFTTEFKHRQHIRRPASIRANYLVTQTGELVMYINGDKQVIAPGTEELVKLFCNQHILHYSDIKAEGFEFARVLYNSGYLEFDRE